MLLFRFRMLMAFIFVFVAFLSCSDSSDCRYLENRKVKMFFVKNNKTYSDTTISKFSVIIPALSKNFYDTISSNTLNLSLSQNSDTSIFIFKIKNTKDTLYVSDTLVFFSTRKLEMISSDCGFNTRFVVDSLLYTDNNILSIQKLEGNIDKEVLKNFRIIMKPAPAVLDTTL